LICDTGAILAAFSADQRYHQECAAALRLSRSRLISPVVLTEVDFLAGRLLGQRTAARIVAILAGPEYQILPYTSETLSAATEVMTAYADLGLGIVDASLVAHAKQQRTNEVFTLDQRHFRAIRSLDGRHFKLLPFDSE